MYKRFYLVPATYDRSILKEEAIPVSGLTEVHELHLYIEKDGKIGWTIDM